MPVKTILNLIDMFGIKGIENGKFGQSGVSRVGLTIQVYEQLKSIHKTRTNQKPERS